MSEVGVLRLQVLSYTMAGVEELLGVHGHGFWMNLMEMLNQKVLRRVLERNPEMFMDNSLFQEERKIEYKVSISHNSPLYAPHGHTQVNTCFFIGGGIGAFQSRIP